MTTAGKAMTPDELAAIKAWGQQTGIMRSVLATEASKRVAALVSEVERLRDELGWANQALSLIPGCDNPRSPQDVMDLLSSRDRAVEHSTEMESRYFKAVAELYASREEVVRLKAESPFDFAFQENQRKVFEQRDTIAESRNLLARELADAQAEISRLKAQNERMRAVLKRVSNIVAGRGFVGCPACFFDGPHASNCNLAAVLKEEP